jgi:hypothetical protein
MITADLPMGSRAEVAEPILATCSRIVFASVTARSAQSTISDASGQPTHANACARSIRRRKNILMVALPRCRTLQLIAASTASAPRDGLRLLAGMRVLSATWWCAQRLERGAFDADAFELPVAIGALVWSIIDAVCPLISRMI